MKRTIAGVALLLALGFSAPAFAQGHQIVIQAPGPAGAFPDVVARIVADKLGAELGRPVIIQNNPGISGNINSGYNVAKAKPDGDTIMLGETGALSISPLLIKDVPYDPKSLVPIAGLGSVPLVMVCGMNQPATLADLVKAAKDKPGQLNYGTAGQGTLANLGIVLFMQRAGIKMEQVAYKDMSPFVNAAITGEVACIATAIPLVLNAVQKGQERAVAVTSAERIPILPDVPTMAEQGYPDFQVVSNFGFLTTPGTPPAIVQTLQAAISKVAQDPSVRDRLGAATLLVRPTSSEAYGLIVKDDFGRFADAVKAAGLTAQ